MSESPRCKNCHFFVPVVSSDWPRHDGQCMIRSTPIVHVQTRDREKSTDIMFRFPIRFNDDWCGEFQQSQGPAHDLP